MNGEVAIPKAAVSVVIPTHGRPDLVARAVMSAFAQTHPPTQVIVVIDGPDAATEERLRSIQNDGLVVVAHATSTGAGAARNTGVQHATGDYIAFLDDDDVWYPTKLELQLEAHLKSSRPDLTVSGTAAHVDYRGQVVTWPRRVPRPDERIPEYLFVRNMPGEGALFTPSLLIPRRVALECPMPTHLSTHEEWDWLVTLDARGVRAIVELTPLGRFDTRPGRLSLSSRGEWKASLDWAFERRSDLGDRVFSAFVLVEVGRSATRAGAGPLVGIYLLLVAFTGRPRLWDVARYLTRPLVMTLRQ